MKSLYLTYLIGFFCFSSVAGDYAPLSTEEIKSIHEQNKVLFLDVRSMGEWQKGHLSKAKHIPIKNLKKIQSKQDFYQKLGVSEETKIYTHCHSGAGGRSKQAFNHLKKLGVKNVEPLKQGFTQFKKAKFAIEHGK